MWYFYVLQSHKDKNWFYKGSTDRLEKRLSEHNSGLVDSTKSYQPLELVYYEAYKYEFAARIRESHVKKSGSIWIPMKKRIIESLNKY